MSHLPYVLLVLFDLHLHISIYYFGISDLLAFELNNGLLNILDRGLDLVRSKKGFNIFFLSFKKITYVFHIKCHLSLVTCTHPAVALRFHRWGVTSFLQCTLFEDVFMQQPQDFIDCDNPHHVYKLCNYIYGLKQAPCAWYHELRQFLVASRFHNSHADTSVFVFKNSGIMIYLLVYVDDIILTSNDVEVGHTLDLYRNFLELKSLHILMVYSSFNGGTSSIYSLELA